jgi:hypothetical protein
LALDFTPTEEEIEFANSGARRPASRLSMLVLLKFLLKNVMRSRQQEV